MSDYRKENQELIMGCHALEEVFTHAPERFSRILAVRLSDKTRDRKNTLLHLAQEHKVPVEYLSRPKLDKLCDSTSHQGFAALVKKQDSPTLKAFLKADKTPSLVVALDSIYDPHNLGAILRASECFGVDLVLWSKNRGSKITPTVSKASSSASIWLPTLKVSNLSTTLKAFKDHGYTLLVAHLGQSSENLFSFEFPEKTLLLMGSEGEGVRPILQKMADAFLEIPMYGKIDSLNVSQATTLFCGFWKSQYS